MKSWYFMCANFGYKMFFCQFFCGFDCGSVWCVDGWQRRQRPFDCWQVNHYSYDHQNARLACNYYCFVTCSCFNLCSNKDGASIFVPALTMVVPKPGGQLPVTEKTLPVALEVHNSNQHESNTVHFICSNVFHFSFLITNSGGLIKKRWMKFLQHTLNKILSRRAASLAGARTPKDSLASCATTCSCVLIVAILRTGKQKLMISRFGLMCGRNSKVGLNDSHILTPFMRGTVEKSNINYEKSACCSYEFKIEIPKSWFVVKCSSSELNYLFEGWYWLPKWWADSAGGITKEKILAATAIQCYWANFVHNGNPSTNIPQCENTNNAEWTQYTPTNKKFLNLQGQSSMMDVAGATTMPYPDDFTPGSNRCDIFMNATAVWHNLYEVGKEEEQPKQQMSWLQAMQAR